MAASTNNIENHRGSPVVSVPLHLGLFPVLDNLSGECDPQTIQLLKSAFTEAEKAAPGFTQELLSGVIQKEAPNEISFTKSLLRMSGQDSQEHRLHRTEREFVRLSEQSRKLKVILSRIPDEMNDRPRFLQTIKDIASAIKDLLSAVNAVFHKYSTRENKRTLDLQKKEFVKCSKSFSDTLKSYFRDGSEVPVYVSANRLIHQANAILLVFKTSSTGF
uniref:Programmed cell death protein 10 n=1 Tax=Phallusia mammillata TaxID=59560 RepID=A0A6F9DNV7_9ASCI|nr:programmed cell death protein 10 [Phallusia mammillata]